MIYQFLNLLIVAVIMGVCLAAGAYIGELRMRDRIHRLMEDSPRGDKARDELGLFLEWASPDPMVDGELARLCGPWRNV